MPSADGTSSVIQPDDAIELWADASVDEGLRTRSVHGAAVTAGAQAIRFLTMMGSQIWLARILAPFDFGLVAMVTPIIGFVAVVADLGITQALISRERLRLDEINAFFWLSMGLSLGLALLAALAAPLIGWLFHEPRVIPVALASAALILVNGAALVPIALLNRNLRFGAAAAIEALALTASAAGGVGAALAGAGYWSLVVAQAATAIVTTLGAWVTSRWTPSAPGHTREAGEMLAFGGKVTVGNLANYLNSTFDNTLIGAVRGATELGFYDRAWRFGAQPLSLLISPFGRIGLPILSRLTHDPVRYRRAFGQLTQVLLIAVVPAMAVGFVDAAAIIDVVLGPRWAAAVPVFSWLCFGGMVTPLNTVAGWAYISQGRVDEQMRVTIAAIVINIAAYTAGVHFSIGMVAAISSISVYLLQAPILVLVMTRTGPIDRKYLWAMLIPNAIAAVVTLGVAAMLQPNVVGIVWLSIAGLASVFTYVSILALFASSRAAILQLLTTFSGSLIQRRSGERLS